MKLAKTIAAVAMLSAFINGVYATNANNAKLPAGIAQQQMVNINTATVSTLSQLKGIGEKRAQAIIAYRQQHGKFTSLDELAKVPGIGQKRLAALRSQLHL